MSQPLITGFVGLTYIGIVFVIGWIVLLLYYRKIQKKAHNATRKKNPYVDDVRILGQIEIWITICFEDGTKESFVLGEEHPDFHTMWYWIPGTLLELQFVTYLEGRERFRPSSYLRFREKSYTTAFAHA